MVFIRFHWERTFTSEETRGYRYNQCFPEDFFCQKHMAECIIIRDQAYASGPVVVCLETRL